MIGRRKTTASSLRQRLTLQTEVQTPDSAGGYVRTWEDIADLWAEIIPVSGRERLFGGQLQSEISHRIVLRYRDGITAGQRLVFENRAFNIRYVSNTMEANETLELLAEEGTTN